MAVARASSSRVVVASCIALVLASTPAFALAPAWHTHAVSSAPARNVDGGKLRSSQQHAVETILRRVKTAVTSIALGVTVLGSSLAFPAFAEDELAAMANGKFNPDLVSIECFATSCKEPTKACVDDADCKKGLMCTARCLGDSGCITSCFARFGNEILNDLLQCSIEDYKCINIAIIPPGAQPEDEVSPPPKELVSTFTPASMEGSWYKVLGWNRQYDCFDCQKNNFAVSSDSTAGMDVDFSMVAKRPGRGEVSKALGMHEAITFDKSTYPSATGPKKALRTAHTQGRMFGLTFWENWYVIGENSPTEPPFKFIYYTGKTLQNTYSGAFVYAREPEIPAAAMASVRRVAKQAGLDPDKFCRIRNACFANDDGGSPQSSPATLLVAPALAEDHRITAGGALSAIVDVADPRRFATSVDAPLALRARALWYDVLDYVDDPHDHARWMFDQQQQMVWPQPATALLSSSER